MKNIKLILVAVSLSLVSFNMAFATIPGSTQGSTAQAPSQSTSSECNSCLEDNKCISTIQDHVRTASGTGGNSDTQISHHCMNKQCSDECSAEIKNHHSAKKNHHSAKDKSK